MTVLAALVGGLAVLVLGAELVVRHGSALAEGLGVSPLVVGMTVVSLGTSLPELAIGVNAARQGNGGLAIGNIVGTNLVNLMLVLGLSAVIRPVVFESRTLRVDAPVMTVAAILLLLLARDGELSTADGAALLAFGLGYVVALVRTSVGVERRAAALEPPRADVPRTMHAGLRAALLCLGMIVIVGGSELLVDGAVGAARNLGVADAVVGLTVVAIGTSAPELVTTLVSTVRGDRSLALGNLLGSSVFNIALILGTTVVFAPGSVPVPDDVLAFDLLLMTAGAAVCVPAFWTQRRLSRAEGVLFVTSYVGYLAWLLIVRL